MKKIIAVLLSMVMMLSGCAFASGFEIGIDSVTIIQNNEITMQLADPGIRLGFAEGEDGMGLRAALEANGQTALEAIITLGAEKLMARASGISDVYSISMEALGGLVQTLMGTMSVSGMAPTEADMEIVNQIVNTASTAAQNGMYYSEDGATMGVTISDADIRTLFDQVIQLAKGHPEILAMMEMTPEDMDDFAVPDDIELTADASLSYTETGMAAQLAVLVNTSTVTGIVSLNAESDMASYVSLTASVFENDAVLAAANVVIGFEATDGAWLIPADTASVDVLTMDETQLEKLTTEAQALLSAFGL